ncbi:MAG TPA: hypothetical protein VFQ27_14850 [Xanthobacteraceae bacterium]|nr:hypothetical protein [Xanthobacteraceae bacterium]
MSADGTWSIVIDTPMGQREAQLELSTADGKLTGRQSADGQSGAITDTNLNGNELAWKIDITDPMPMTLEFSGVVEGDTLSGNVRAGAFGSFPFRGRRV